MRKAERVTIEIDRAVVVRQGTGGPAVADRDRRTTPGGPVTAADEARPPELKIAAAAVSAVKTDTAKTQGAKVAEPKTTDAKTTDAKATDAKTTGAKAVAAAAEAFAERLRTKVHGLAA